MAAVCAKVEAANKVSITGVKTGGGGGLGVRCPPWLCGPLLLPRTCFWGGSLLSFLCCSSKIPSKPFRCSRNTTAMGERLSVLPQAAPVPSLCLLLLPRPPQSSSAVSQSSLVPSQSPFSPYSLPVASQSLPWSPQSSSSTIPTSPGLLEAHPVSPALSWSFPSAPPAPTLSLLPQPQRLHRMQTRRQPGASHG